MPSWLSGFRTTLARKGTTVSETASDAATVAMTATGIERMKSPAGPGRASKGTKARISVAVHPRTETVICLVAVIAEGLRQRRDRRHRQAFFVDAIAVRARRRPGHQRATRGNADGTFRIRARIARSAGGELIESRSLDRGMAGRAQQAAWPMVGGDQQNIGLIGLR